MESACKELQPHPRPTDVYEIPGEPATVIDGFPNLDHNDQSALCIATESETLKCSGLGEWMDGREVQKKFGKQVYSGSVVSFDKETSWYRVVYVDGDYEDLWWHELQEILVPLDISISLKTLATKRLKKKSAIRVNNTTGNQRSSKKQSQNQVV
ncbi:hypothetical protein ACHQM5_014582 [Ranunculus cassubicifolius]